MAGGDGVDIVGCPVNAGGDDEGVGAGIEGGAVVGNVGDTGALAGSGRAHGVGVLADELAAVVDEGVGGFLLCRLVIPGAGEGDFHSCGGADGARAEEEGGVAGDDLRVGVCADVADLCLVCGELTRVDHFVELHTGGDTGEVAPLIDGGKGVVVVGKPLGVGARAGRVAELNLGKFLGGGEHIGLMTERVGKNDAAAGIGKLLGCLLALLRLGYIGLEDVLILAQTQLRARGFGGVHEVEVIGGVLVMQEDEADLEIGGGGVGRAGLTAGAQCKYHDERQKHCDELFHSFVSPHISCKFIKTVISRV